MKIDEKVPIVKFFAYLAKVCKIREKIDDFTHSGVNL